jgi:hypothetical protein
MSVRKPKKRWVTFYPAALDDWIWSIGWDMRALLGGLLVVLGFQLDEILRPAPRAEGEPAQALLFTLLALVAVVVASELLRPKPKIEDARLPGLGDFRLATATEGRPVPVFWGTVKISGANVTWYGDLSQEAVFETVRTGLFSKDRFLKNYRYNLGIQFTLGTGPDVSLLKVWIAETEVYSGVLSSSGRFDIDEPTLLGDDEGIQTTVDFYDGSASQTPNAYLDTTDRQRIGTAATPTCPAYNNDCYLVARELTSADPDAGDKGAYIGNTTSPANWEFEVLRFPAKFSGQTGTQNQVGAADANPMNVAYELLTNTDWGFGFDPSKIDVGLGSSFVTAAATLISEGNGFSMLMERSISAQELLDEIQRQIDGVIFFDHVTGLWKVKLARDDYTLASLPVFDDSDVKAVKAFERGTWQNTTNQIQVKFFKREDDYKESYALAQDMANAIILSGGNTTNPVSTTGPTNYPGVKDSDLANSIAWRDLRAAAYPLISATLVVNREIWELGIGDVFKWTNADRDISELPVRITRIVYGPPTSNQIEVTVAQDIFKFRAPSGGAPQGTGWSEAQVSLVAYPSDEQIAFEAPRALVVRDPDYTGDPDVSKVMCAARRQGGEVGFNMTQRNSSGTPGGSYAAAGTCYALMKIGELDADLDAGEANPVSTVTINATPDTQAQLEAAFNDATTLNDLGTDLTQLILVGNEFMLVQSAADSGADVDLQTVYRGALDSAQENHSAGDSVYLLFAGASITDTIFPNTYNVDIELRMRSISAAFTGSVTKIGLTMNKRTLRPNPPAAVLYNGSSTAYGTPDFEGDGGAGLNDFGFDVDWWRRKHAVTDEVTALLSDDSGVDASTEYRVRVFSDPAGSNTEVYTGSWVTGSGAEFINRLLLLNEAAAGTDIQVRIETRHDYAGETDIASRYNLTHVSTPTSVFDGLFYFGGKLTALAVSNVYTAAATGTFTLRIGVAYSTTNVQARLNGGSWTTVIAAGVTSGTFAVTSGDLVEIRHTSSETPSLQLVQLEDPSATVVAYGVLNP